MKVALALLAALAIALPWSVMARQSSQRVPIAPSQESAEGISLGGAGVPQGAMILTKTEVAPPGYTFTGLDVLARTGTSQSWRTRAPMPTARFYLAAASVDGKVYAIGGTADTIQILDVVERYDPATNTWTTVAPMLTPRWGLAAATLSGKIYAIGGAAATGYTAALEEYDPATDSWIPRAPMPTARAYLAAATLNGKFYAIGGQGVSGSMPLTKLASFA